MSGREVMYLLVLFAVALSAEDEPGPKLDKEHLTIQGLEVTLICPLENVKTWHKYDTDQKISSRTFTIEKYGHKNNGLYRCGENYYFYTKLTVCEGCVELEMPLAIGLVVGDVLITLGVILIVFFCAKKKTPPAPPQRPAAHARQTSTPAPQDSNYQSLNPATRTKDIYAEAARKH